MELNINLTDADRMLRANRPAQMQKNRHFTATKCREIAVGIEKVWMILSNKYPQYPTIVNNFLSDTNALHEFRHSVKLASPNGKHLSLDDLEMTFVKVAISFCHLALGHENTLRLTELSPLGTLFGSTRTVFYSFEPTQDNDCHGRVQETLLADIVLTIGTELYPSEMYNGVLRILQEVNVDEAILGPALKMVVTSVALNQGNPALTRH